MSYGFSSIRDLISMGMAGTGSRAKFHKVINAGVYNNSRTKNPSTKKTNKASTRTHKPYSELVYKASEKSS